MSTFQIINPGATLDFTNDGHTCTCKLSFTTNAVQGRKLQPETPRMPNPGTMIDWVWNIVDDTSTPPQTSYNGIHVFENEAPQFYFINIKIQDSGTTDIEERVYPIVNPAVSAQQTSSTSNRYNYSLSFRIYIPANDNLTISNQPSNSNVGADGDFEITYLFKPGNHDSSREYSHNFNNVDNPNFKTDVILFLNPDTGVTKEREKVSMEAEVVDPPPFEEKPVED